MGDEGERGAPADLTPCEEGFLPLWGKVATADTLDVVKKWEKSLSLPFHPVLFLHIFLPSWDLNILRQKKNCKGVSSNSGLTRLRAGPSRGPCRKSLRAMRTMLHVGNQPLFLTERPLGNLPVPTPWPCDTSGLTAPRGLCVHSHRGRHHLLESSFVNLGLSVLLQW